MAEKDLPFFFQHSNFPVITEDVLERVHQNQVVLEYFFIRGPIGYGTVRVKNRAFNKNIFVRYTVNRWKTEFRFDANYMMHLNETDTDRFQFKLAPNSVDFDGSKELEFVIGYSVNEELLWDNNFTNNYQLDIIYKTEKVTREDQILSIYKPLEKSDESAEIPCGMKNVTGSCYLNSAIQCLAVTKPLNDLLFQNLSESIWKKPITNEYINILKLLWSNEYLTIDTFPLKQIFGHINMDYLKDEQHDAHEFLTQFIYCLDDESNSNQKYFELFEGLQKFETACCVCSNVSQNFESFLVLSVPIPKHNCASLNDCIEDMLTEEIISENNQWICSKCNDVRPMKRKVTIQQFPKILIIHLKRFYVTGDGYLMKNHMMVYYPIKLSFNKNIEKADYTLYAVINHKGSIRDGHYSAFHCTASSQTATWWHLDDENVEKLSDNEHASNPDAYLLFYEIESK